MYLVVLADTHLRDGSAQDLPERVWAAIDEADAILHAGDVTGNDLLARLAARAPTYAVLGNNDHGLVGRLPERREDVFAGPDGSTIRVAMVHDSGARAGRAARMKRWFPSADLVVFGHSHEPCDQVESGIHLFNPGSAIQRRRQPYTTFGTIEVAEGGVVRTQIHRAMGV
ncbi:MAG: metallophosphoesterase family protein [Ilumatobacteraceae bacterium]